MFLAVMDACSKYLKVVPMSQPTGPTYTIVALRHILSYFGLRIHNL